MDTLREALRRKRNLLSHRIGTLPILILMPHEGCNCRCLTCDLWRSEQPGREFSTLVVERILEGVERWGVRRIVLSGGEALLHTDLWGLCSRLKSRPLGITLLTNGLLLAQQAADVAHWCDEVIVSLDGAGTTHDELRGVPGASVRLAKGISALKALDPISRISGRCVVQRRNFGELPLIVAEARRLGLDRISFLAADVSTSAFNRVIAWDKEQMGRVALSPARVVEFGATLEQAFRDLRGEFASGFIAESPAKLRRLEAYYAALAGDGEFPPVECNAPWVSAVVEADGTVRPCFFHQSLGNLSDAPLEEILNSPEAISFRRSLNVRDNEVCRRCVCSLKLGLRAAV